MKHSFYIHTQGINKDLFKVNPLVKPQKNTKKKKSAQHHSQALSYSHHIISTTSSLPPYLEMQG